MREVLLSGKHVRAEPSAGCGIAAHACALAGGGACSLGHRALEGEHMSFFPRSHFRMI